MGLLYVLGWVLESQKRSSWGAQTPQFGRLQGPTGPTRGCPELPTSTASW